MPFIETSDGGSGSSGSGSGYGYVAPKYATLKKLWENASSTSSFAAQEIELNLSPYNVIVIEYLVSTGNSNQIHTVFGRKGTTLMMPFVSNREANYGGRQCIISDTGVQFGEAYNHTMTAARQYAIPKRIFGVANVKQEA